MIYDLLKRYGVENLAEIISEIEKNPAIIGAPEGFLSDLQPEHRRCLIAGEFLAKASKDLGILASKYLKHGQWNYTNPDWYDHRHHTLYWEVESKNSWLESASLVLRHLPLNGRILNICAGDAWLDCNVYANMASEIQCVDIKLDSYKQYVATNVNRHPKVKYEVANIFDKELPGECFDVVIMRSAIEHFTQEDQYRLYEKIKAALKPEGWFVGDTPCSTVGEKMHNAHEHEWIDEDQARGELSRYFSRTRVYSLYCNIDPRTTLFWECQK